MPAGHRFAGATRFIPRLAATFGAAWVSMLCLALAATPAAAQIEVLLRGLEPAPPKAGACGSYKFSADEPSGPRQVVFTACVERIDAHPGGSVFLRLSSGDSLDARVEVSPELFAGKGGSLLDYVRSVVEIAHGDTTRLARDAWASLPGFDSTPRLPGSKSEELGNRDFKVGSRTLHAHGRKTHEQNEQTKPLGGVQMTQKAARDIESWMSAEAPILGVVHATATLTSERKLSAPVAGVPQEGARTWRYVLELLDVGAPAKKGRGAGKG